MIVMNGDLGKLDVDANEENEHAFDKNDNLT